MKELKIIELTRKLPRHPTRRYKNRRLKEIKGLVLHCTDNTWTVEELARRDITPGKSNPVSSKGCPECTYHYFIDHDGTIYHTVNMSKIVWHAAGYNSKTAAVVIRYIATNNPNPPGRKQMTSVYRLLTKLALMLRVVPDSLHIRGHRELRGTGYLIRNGHKRLKKTCPGLLINLDTVRVKVAKLMQLELKRKSLYKGGIDGIFGPNSMAALDKYGK